MNTFVRRVVNAVRSFPWTKAAAAAGVLVYLLICAKALLGVQDPFGGVHPAVPIAIALFPLCFFLSFRFPLIFPFGLYLALMPFDALFSVSGASSLVRLIGIATAAALLLRMLLMRRAFAPQRSWFFWLAFVGYAALSLIWAPDTVNGPVTFFSILMLFVMMTVLGIYPSSQFEFKVAIGMIVPCAVGAAIFALKNFYSGNISAGDARLALQGLTSGYILDANYLGGSFLLSLAIALVGVFYSRSLTLRVASGLAVLPIMAAILVTGSRSAFGAAVVIFAYFAVRSKYRVQAFAICGVALGLTALYPRVLARLFDSTADTASGRTYIWQTGMHSFGDHWLFGAGVGSYVYNYDHNVLQVFQQQFAGWSRPGHSLFFVGLNDFGIVGFVLVLACWYASFRQLSVIPKSSWLYGLRLGCEAAIVGLFIQGLFIDPFYIKYIWLALSLPLMVVNMYAPRVMRVGQHMPVPSARFRPAQPIRGT